jgi:hypothetical protein
VSQTSSGKDTQKVRNFIFLLCSLEKSFLQWTLERYGDRYYIRNKGNGMFLSISYAGIIGVGGREDVSLILSPERCPWRLLEESKGLRYVISNLDASNSSKRPQIYRITFPDKPGITADTEGGSKAPGVKIVLWKSDSLAAGQLFDFEPV